MIDQGDIMCPSCAEVIKAAAKRCRYCGHDLTPWWQFSSGGSQRSSSGGCGTVVATLGVLFVAFVYFFGDTKDRSAVTEPVQVAATLDAETIEKCRGLLKQGEQSRVIRKIDKPAKRLYVDERLWRELGPDARKGVAGSAVCDWFALKIDNSTFDQSVMVVSWQSGEQLSLVANGMYVDNMN